MKKQTPPCPQCGNKPNATGYLRHKKDCVENPLLSKDNIAKAMPKPEHIDISDKSDKIVFDGLCGKLAGQVDIPPVDMDIHQWSAWISVNDHLPADLQQVLIHLKAKYVRPAIGRDWMGWTMADAVFQDMKEVWDKLPAEQRSQYLVEKNFYRLTGRYVWHGQGNNKFSHDDVTHWMALPKKPDVATREDFANALKNKNVGISTNVRMVLPEGPDVQ